MAFVTPNDLGALTMEQVGQRRGINVAQLGVTNMRGCFSTIGAPISGAKAAVLQDVQNIAARSVQPNLTQEEVSLILATRSVAKDKVQELLDHANRTKDAWVAALNAISPLKSCVGTGALSTIAAAFTGSFESTCKSERASYNAAWADAADKLRGLSPRSTEAFRAVDFLGVFAQNTKDAAALCEAKLNARAQYQDILDKIEPIVKQVNSEEAALKAVQQGAIDALLNMLQAFMALLKTLIEAIGAAFQGLVAAAGFIAGTIAPFVATNPKTILAGFAGLLALGAGGYGYYKYRQAKAVISMVSGR